MAKYRLLGYVASGISDDGEDVQTGIRNPDQR